MRVMSDNLRETFDELANPPARLKIFHLRSASVIGCSLHGPFGRDRVDSCPACRTLGQLRASRVGGFTHGAADV